MAEFLIRTETDPYPSRPWKRGDIIGVFGDGTYSASPDNRNIVIRVSGMAVADALVYIATLCYQETSHIDQRRRYRISDAVLDAVVTAGRFATRNKTQINAAIIDKTA